MKGGKRTNFKHPHATTIRKKSTLNTKFTVCSQLFPGCCLVLDQRRNKNNLSCLLSTGDKTCEWAWSHPTQPQCDHLSDSTTSHMIESPAKVTDVLNSSRLPQTSFHPAALPPCLFFYWFPSHLHTSACIFLLLFLVGFGCLRVKIEFIWALSQVSCNVCLESDCALVFARKGIKSQPWSQSYINRKINNPVPFACICKPVDLCFTNDIKFRKRKHITLFQSNKPLFISQHCGHTCRMTATFLKAWSLRLGDWQTVSHRLNGWSIEIFWPWGQLAMRHLLTV